MAFSTPNAPGKDIPARNPVRQTLHRLKAMPTASWLSKPIYHNFLRAVNYTSKRTKDINRSPLTHYQKGVWLYLHEGEQLVGEYECVGNAMMYYYSDLVRSHLNALFFGGADLDTVHAHTGIDPQSLDAYYHLFCDLSVFKGVRLFLLEYIQLLPETTDEDVVERSLYKMSVDYGWRWVIWKLSRGLNGFRSNTEVIDSMINVAFYRAMEAAGDPLTSKAAKEGKQYLKLAAQLAINRHNAKIGQLSSVQDLALKLSALTPTDMQGYINDLFDGDTQPIPGIEDLLREKQQGDSDIWDDTVNEES